MKYMAGECIYFVKESKLEAQFFKLWKNNLAKHRSRCGPTLRKDFLAELK